MIILGKNGFDEKKKAKKNHTEKQIEKRDEIEIESKIVDTDDS